MTDTVKLTFLQAIARQEGFYAPQTRPARNNNPGDIEYGKFAIAHGATGTDGRFAIFHDEEAGFAAMRALLSTAYLGLTLEQAIAKWAPASENNDGLYVHNVSLWTGMEPGTVLTPENLG